MGFYDPIKNQTYSNVPVNLYFLEKGAQLRVYRISIAIL